MNHLRIVNVGIKFILRKKNQKRIKRIQRLRVWFHLSAAWVLISNLLIARSCAAVRQHEQTKLSVFCLTGSTNAELTCPKAYPGLPFSNQPFCSCFISISPLPSALSLILSDPSLFLLLVCFLSNLCSPTVSFHSSAPGWPCPPPWCHSASILKANWKKDHKDWNSEDFDSNAKMRRTGWGKTPYNSNHGSKCIPHCTGFFECDYGFFRAWFRWLWNLRYLKDKKIAARITQTLSVRLH